MKSILASALIALAPALALAAPDTPAAKTPAKTTAAAKTKEAAAKPAAKPAAPVKKQTSSRTQLKTATNQVAAGLIAAEAALSPAELSIAERVHTGRIACELGAYVNVQTQEKTPGHFLVSGKGFNYHMVPVETTTGTVRLEDKQAGAVWLQIANKSMLMNQKQGQRLADECMSPDQMVVAEAIKKNPPPSVFDAAPAK